MPVIINLAANFVLGAALVLAVRNSPALKQGFLSWQLLFLMAFEALVVTPIATYLFRFYPQWSMLYFFDPQLYPDLERWITLLSAAVILANFGALVGGFAVARRGILQGNLYLRLAPLAAGTLIILATAILFGDRVALLGDFDAFWQGTAILLLKRLPGWLGVGMYLAAIGFVFWVKARFKHHDPTLL